MEVKGARYVAGWSVLKRRGVAGEGMLPGWRDGRRAQVCIAIC